MAFLNIINQVKDNTSKIISEKGYDNVDFVVEYSRSGLVILPVILHFYSQKI